VWPACGTLARRVRRLAAIGVFVRAPGRADRDAAISREHGLGASGTGVRADRRPAFGRPMTADGFVALSPRAQEKERLWGIGFLLQGGAEGGPQAAGGRAHIPDRAPPPERGGTYMWREEDASWRTGAIRRDNLVSVAAPGAAGNNRTHDDAFCRLHAKSSAPPCDPCRGGAALGLRFQRPRVPGELRPARGRGFCPARGSGARRSDKLRARTTAPPAWQRR
jgi:hypothetical protein